MFIHVCLLLSPSMVLFFFFNDTATTEIYTLSLHDALPISGIYPLADGDSRHQRAVDRIGDCHDLVAATTEQQMVRPVDGQSRGSLAACQGPLPFHPHRGRVDLRYRILVLQVDKQFPVS